MGHRRTRVFTFLATAAAAAGIAMPALPAGAAGEQLVATPATNLLNGDNVQVSLSGASAFEGDQVYFAECDAATAAAQYPGVATAACGTFQPQSGTTVTNGAASGIVKMVYGALPNGAGSCTAANNGSCVITAFAVVSGSPAKVAATPITFAAATAASMTVTPSSNLDDGTTVAVTVANIPNGTAAQLDLLQCHTSGDPSTWSYGQSPCRYVTTVPVSNHALSTSIAVKYGPIAATPSIACNETPAGQCGIEAVDNTNDKIVAASLISFEAPKTGFAVTPATGLAPGQKVHVTASGFPSSVHPTMVVECNTTYAAAHGDPAFYLQDLSACRFGNATADFNLVNGAAAAYLPITDGPAENGSSSCTYATNGQCAIQLLAPGTNGSGTYGYTVVASQPITFRAPVTGPPTIAAQPTTGLHSQSPGAVAITVGKIPDYVDSVDLEECNPQEVAKWKKVDDALFYGCSTLKTIPVVNNNIGIQKFTYVEGGVGNKENQAPCDHTHACTIALWGSICQTCSLGYPNAPAYPAAQRLGNAIPISFRAPNFGTPTIRLAKLTGLVGGAQLGMKVTDVPDLVRALNIYECNIKGGYNAQKCAYVPFKPGDHGAAIVHDNVAQGSVRIKAGVVGETTTGKKVYCNANTNGQCALVAITYPGSTYRIKSPIIRFA